ncbi:MAG: cyclic pyranopterin monophosphate synthase MoaC [Synergistaceae bacterium]
MSEYTHFDNTGSPVLVDVSDKIETKRCAYAEAWITLPQATLNVLLKGNVKKGNPFTIAELAGIMGAKKTSSLIPLCHNIKVENVVVKCELVREKQSVVIRSEVVTTDVTGVEMEALTSVSVAALCFYDMCKALDKGMVIKDIRLLRKTGGKSGDWVTMEVYNG